MLTDRFNAESIVTIDRKVGTFMVVCSLRRVCARYEIRLAIVGLYSITLGTDNTDA